MAIIDTANATLLLIDFQTRLMPAIDDGPAVIANARRLVSAAALLGAPVLFTAQNPRGLGGIVRELQPEEPLVFAKMTFDAGRTPGFDERLAEGHAIILTGCEAHVCVLQTALGLVARGRRVFVVCDAVGSRRAESKAVGLRRMEQGGVEIVTTEMVVFEGLGSAEHPRFREAVALIK